jgi:type II secretory pathway component GspD/PulD (secretin)
MKVSEGVARRRILAWFLVLCVSMLSFPVVAQQYLEILELRHRPAEEVLPVLHPLLEPGATLSGMNNQLFLRASARNREEIKRALATLDVPVRRLLIRVTTDLDEETRHQGGQLSGRLGNDRVQIELPSGKEGEGGRDHRITARVHERHGARSGASTQMVQTMDGERAFIQIGVSVAVPLRQITQTPNGRVVVSDSAEYRDIGRGFYAEPRVIGDQVTVEISQRADTPSHHGAGSAQIQRLSTRISGRLGEWMQLGGVRQSASGAADGAFTYSTRELQTHRGVWLMVEELP